MTGTTTAFLIMSDGKYNNKGNVNRHLCVNKENENLYRITDFYGQWDGANTPGLGDFVNHYLTPEAMENLIKQLLILRSLRT